jgi:integrase/recombinase XerD
MRTTHGAAGFPVLLKGFRLALAVEGLRPKTVNNYLRDAESFAKHFEDRSPRTISPGDIRAFVATLQEGHAPKTVREAQLALRRFFRFLVREGELRRDPTSDMKLTSFRVEPQPTYREAEVKRLLLACDSRTLEGVRDKALILTLFDTGVREGELVSMGLPDWEKHIVRVDGKTGVRDVPLGTAT